MTDDFTPVNCPHCGLTWSVQTPRSWWLRWDRCFACQQEAAGSRRPLTHAEARRFETFGQQTLGLS